MAGLLEEFLRESCRQRLVWGADGEDEIDCYWWGVRWLERAQGVPLQHVRDRYLGKYWDARSCLRLARTRGGMLGAFDEVASEACAPRVAEPRRGDLVAVAQGRQVVLGISLGARSALRADVGLAVVAAPVRAAWRTRSWDL